MTKKKVESAVKVTTVVFEFVINEETVTPAVVGVIKGIPVGSGMNPVWGR